MTDHELWSVMETVLSGPATEIEEVMVHILKITRADMSILEYRVGRI